MENFINIIKSDNVTAFKEAYFDNTIPKRFTPIPSILKDNSNLVGLVSFYGGIKCFLFLTNEGNDPISCDIP